MKLRLIAETDEIKAGMTLYDKVPVLGWQKTIVTKVTKTLIICGNARYDKDGALKTDEYGRRRLHIPAE